MRWHLAGSPRDADAPCEWLQHSVSPEADAPPGVAPPPPRPAPCRPFLPVAVPSHTIRRNGTCRVRPPVRAPGPRHRVSELRARRRACQGLRPLHGRVILPCAPAPLCHPRVRCWRFAPPPWATLDGAAANVHVQLSAWTPRCRLGRPVAAHADRPEVAGAWSPARPCTPGTECRAAWTPPSQSLAAPPRPAAKALLSL